MNRETAAEPSDPSISGPVLSSSACVDITPDVPIPLFGYPGRDQPSREIGDPLEINAILFSQGEMRVALVSVDTLFAGVLEDALHAVLKFPHNLQIIVCATHTHYAPCIDSGKPRLGTVESAYFDLVMEKATECLNTLVGSEGQGAFVKTGGRRVAKTGLAINRRDSRIGLSRSFPFIGRKTAMAPNTDEPYEFPLTVIPIVSDGEVVSILWHWTCHPVSAPKLYEVSASFPGAVREAFRRELSSPNLPVVFLQGFCGDVRPTVGIRKPTLREALRAFPGEVFGAPTVEQYADWITDVVAEACRALKSCEETSEVRGSLTYRDTRIPLTDLMPGTSPAQNLSVGSLEIGDRFKIVLVSAEVVAEHEGVVAGIHGEEALCVAYRGNCFGYLPSDRQLLEGGFEVDGFLHPFSMDRPFGRGLDAALGKALENCSPSRQNTPDDTRGFG